MLAILVTAPIGAILIIFFGPKLLEKEIVDSISNKMEDMEDMEENDRKSMLGEMLGEREEMRGEMRGERGGERGEREDDEEMGGSTMDCSIEMIDSPMRRLMVEEEEEKEVDGKKMMDGGE